MAEILPEIETFARIKVIGVGGGGGSAVERMIKSKVGGIEFVAVNTDAQALHFSHAPSKVHIGRQTTRGLGAGADPAVGRRAAEESEAEIHQMVKGADMLFITLGAGGGTGSGASPLIAAAAREAGALVVGIATKPFTFEGERRKRNADQAVEALKENVDTMITIPNDRLLQMIDRKTTLLDAFSVVDDVLRQGVQGISDLITIHGLINLDFADVKAIMQNAGSALMGIGKASGENRATLAAKQAIDSPLLEVSVDGAKGVLFNITGGRNMSMHEIDEAAKTITDAVDPDANIIFGAVLDESMDDEVKITVIATGFEPRKPRAEVERPPLFASPVVHEPRKPFIDEPPRSFLDEVERMGKEDAKESTQVATGSTLPGIEPEPDEIDLMLSADEQVVHPEKRERDVKIPSFDATGMDEDDLDVPAFIRKKVE